jgi:hypothetical protein
MSCDAITLTVGYQKITFTPVCPVLLHVRCASASIPLHLQPVQLRVFVILTANHYYSPEQYQTITVCNDYAVGFLFGKPEVFLFASCSFRHVPALCAAPS